MVNANSSETKRNLAVVTMFLHGSKGQDYYDTECAKIDAMTEEEAEVAYKIALDQARAIQQSAQPAPVA